MSRKENLQERFLDKPSEKLADLEQEIARQDAEAAKTKQELDEKERADESKYAPKDNFFKVDFQPASGGKTIARKTVAATGATVSSSSVSSKEEVTVPSQAPAVKEEKAEVASEAPKQNQTVQAAPPQQASSEMKEIVQPRPVPVEEAVPVAENMDESRPDSVVETKEESSREPEDAGEPVSEKSHSSALFWNICIVLGVAMIGGMGFLIYQQSRNLPEDPLTKAKAEFEQVKEEYNKQRMAYFEVEKRRIHNNALIDKGETLTILEQNVDLKNKRIGDLEREILGVRGEMRSYFQRYKTYTRRKARNLHFDNIITTKTKKTYLDASVQKVTDSYVSIVHAGGATRLDPSDLPEALQVRLGYGDPLGLKTMEAEVDQEKQEKALLDKYLPASQDIRKRQEMTEKLTHLNDDGSPVPQSLSERKEASPAPAISTQQPSARLAPVPASDIEPSSGMPRVDTSAGSLNDNWVPPAAPQPFPEE